MATPECGHCKAANAWHRATLREPLLRISISSSNVNHPKENCYDLFMGFIYLENYLDVYFKILPVRVSYNRPRALEPPWEEPQELSCVRKKDHSSTTLEPPGKSHMVVVRGKVTAAMENWKTVDGATRPDHSEMHCEQLTAKVVPVGVAEKREVAAR